ncbi:MAG: hypothetical protein OK455_03145 [Thaumarchaeota archaeon]|nr:hypothetical protein [Nitrososphaerota archaeon]
MRSLVLVGAVGALIISVLVVGTFTTLHLGTPTSGIQSQSNASSSASFCSTPLPLSLASVSRAQMSLPSVGQLPDLQLTWKNCSAQNISFDLAGPLQITASTQGQEQSFNGTVFGPDSTNLAYEADYTGCTVNGYTVQGASRCEASVGPGSEVIITLPILLPASVSPNALVTGVSGNFTATDPVTGQAISQPTSFGA